MQSSDADADEKNQYLLLGKATHPIAESHLLLSCQARTHLSKKVAVPNVLPKKETTYKVFSDLDCMGGKESVVIPAQIGGAYNPGTYTMHILAPCPGVFHGSITFMAESGKQQHGACAYITIVLHRQQSLSSPGWV